MPNSIELQNELRSINAKMESLYNAAEKENRGFNTDEDAKWSQMVDERASLRSRVENAKLLEQDVKLRAEQKEVLKEVQDKSEFREKAGKEATYGDVFNKYVRTGKAGLTKEERGILKRGYRANSKSDLIREERNQVVGTNNLGGYLVDDSFDTVLIKAMEARSAFMEAAEVIRTTSGETMLMPSLDETAVTGQRVGEAAASTKTNMTFGQKSIGAHKYGSGLIGVSTELVEDMAYNVLNDISDVATDRITDIVNSDMTIGHGGSTHIGASNTGLTQNVTASGVTIAADTWTYDKLADLKYSVNRAYRRNSAFMFSDATCLLLEKLKDNDGRPLLNVSAREDKPDTILGHQFYINDYMADSGTSANIAALFGDFSKYRIRIARGTTLKRSAERYFEEDIVVFLALMRIDAVLRDDRAIRSLAVA